MTGIFLSHSSQDKRFTERLALDLAQRGIPVWFDSWRIDVGAHLTASLKGGIDASDYVLVVLSPHSARSDWLLHEVDTTLALERQLKRNILLPVRIGRGAIPKQLVDRVYADFTGTYLSAFEQLVHKLHDWGVLAAASLDVARMDIPMFVSEGRRLDCHRLSSCLSTLARRRWYQPLASERKLDANQIHLAPDDQYELQRTRAVERVERVEFEQGLDVESREALRACGRWALNCERYLSQGLANLCSTAIPLGYMPGCSAASACECFVRIQRSRILGLFFGVMSDEHQEAFPTAALEPSLHRPLRDAVSAAGVYGLDVMLEIVVTPPGGDARLDGLSVFIPADCPEASHLEREEKLVIDSPNDHIGLISRYIVPQALDRGAQLTSQIWEQRPVADFPFDLTGYCLERDSRRCRSDPHTPEWHRLGIRRARASTSDSRSSNGTPAEGTAAIGTVADAGRAVISGDADTGRSSAKQP
jgi:hypothetical protein